MDEGSAADGEMGTNGKSNGEEEEKHRIRNVSHFPMLNSTYRIFTVAFNSIHCCSFIGRSNFGPEQTEWILCIFVFKSTGDEDEGKINIRNRSSAWWKAHA